MLRKIVIIQKDVYDLRKGNFEQVYDLSEFADGVFLLMIQDGKHRITKRIVKRN